MLNGKERPKKTTSERRECKCNNTEREREANSRAMGHSFTGKAVFYNAQLVSSLSLCSVFTHNVKLYTLRQRRWQSHRTVGQWTIRRVGEGETWTPDREKKKERNKALLGKREGRLVRRKATAEQWARTAHLVRVLFLPFSRNWCVAQLCLFSRVISR